MNLPTPAFVSPASRAELSKLEVAELHELLEERWDTVENYPSSTAKVSITEAERKLLDERLADYCANPSAAQPWDEIRDQLRNGE